MEQYLLVKKIPRFCRGAKTSRGDAAREEGEGRGGCERVGRFWREGQMTEYTDIKTDIMTRPTTWPATSGILP